MAMGQNIKRYNIYSFSLHSILSLGHFDEQSKRLKLDIDETRYSLSNYAEPTQIKPDCIMFQQAEKLLDELGIAPEQENQISSSSNRLANVFITLDFEEAIKTDQYSYIFGKTEEIVLTFEKGEESYAPFLKSNSMTHDCKMYFVNKKYASGLFERLTFNLINSSNCDKSLELPKWFAYTGLVCSQVKPLDHINFKYGEIVIVKDKKFNKLVDAVTAISALSLKEEVDDYCELIKGLGLGKTEKEALLRINSIENIEKKWNCYLASPDYLDLYESEKNGTERIKAKGHLGILECLNCIKEALQKDTLEERCELLIPMFSGDLKYRDTNLGAILSSLSNAGVKEIEIPWMKIRVKNFPHEINAFDGEGLISESFAQEIDREMNGIDFFDQLLESVGVDVSGRRKSKSHSYQIRLPFIKGVVHCCDLQSFFKDNNISSVKGLVNFGVKDGDSYADFPVENIKMILTESQFKLIKFAKYIASGDKNHLEWYIDNLSKFDYHLCINNSEPDQTKCSRLNYEFVSTLPISNSLMNLLIDEDEENRLRQLDDDKELVGLLSDGQKEIFENVSSGFIKSTSSFKDKRRTKFAVLKSKALKSQISINNSWRKFLSADLMDLLFHIIGIDDFNDEQKEDLLDAHEVYIPGTDEIKEGQKVVILRNPHYSRNEIATAIRVADGGKRDKYFGEQTGVIWVSPSMCTAERLGGADYDGDTVMVISDERIVSAVKDKIERRIDVIGDDGAKTKKTINKYPIALIPSLAPSKKPYNQQSICECLKRTFSSKVGKISNDAFKFAEYAYSMHDKSDVQFAKNTDKISDYVCFFTILGGLEIDSAKSGKKPFLPTVSSAIGYVVDGEFDGDIDNQYASNYIRLKEDIGEALSGRALFGDFNDIKKMNSKNKLSVGYDNFSNVRGYSDSENKFNLAHVVEKAAGWEYKTPLYPRFPLRPMKTTEAGKIAFIEAYLIYKQIRGQIDEYVNFQQVNNSRLAFTKGLICKYGEVPIGDNRFGFDFLINRTKPRDINNPKQNVIDYCRSEKKFHYLITQDDKQFYLDDLCLSGFRLEQYVTNFKNGGSKILFLSFLYNFYRFQYGDVKMYKPFESTCSFAINEFNKSFMNKVLSDTKTATRIIDSVNDYMREWTGRCQGKIVSCTEIKNDLNRSLKKDYGNRVSYGDIVEILKDCQDRNIVYDVFVDSLKEYLME